MSQVRTALLTMVGLGLAMPVSGQITDRITIHGYSSFEVERRLSDIGRGDPNGSFDADLFDLVLNVQATDRLRVATDITFEHGAASEDNRGNVAIEYAFAEYFVTDALQLRAGKMFLHFGIYNELHTAKPTTLTVKEPLSTNKNNKFGSDFRFYPRWAVGLAARGQGGGASIEWDYIVQVTNGEQEETNPFEEDDNTAKAVAGRFRVSPLRDVTLGVSAYYDRMTELDANGDDTGERTSLISYGAHLEWLSPIGLGLQAEYTGGFVEPSVLTVGPKIERNAATAMVYQQIAERVTPYVRWEYLDPNLSIDDDIATMWVYGLNLRVDSGLFVKAELNTVQSGANNDRFAGTDFTEFKAAIAVGF